MTYLLHIAVSPQGDNSNSRNVAKAYIESYKQSHPHEVRERDLNANPVPHLDGEGIYAAYVPAEARSDSQKAKNNLRLELIEEIKGAHAIVISSPMWNWNVPSVLKAYIDQIMYIGVLDPYDQKHLAGKPVTFIVASGGAYSEGSWHPEWDYETGYLKMLFGNLGATDLALIRAEYTLAGIVPGMEAQIPKKEESFKAALAAAEARGKH